MNKTFYHNFLPTKAEEEAAIACNKPHQVTRTLVEITDQTYPPPCINSSHPWNIKKSITTDEILTGKLSISHEDMFEHVFRYWTLDMANQVVSGSKCLVILIDYTHEKGGTPSRSYVENGPGGTYLLGFMAVVRKQQLNPGDEIGLFWDRSSGTFGFKQYIASKKLCI